MQVLKAVDILRWLSFTIHRKIDCILKSDTRVQSLKSVPHARLLIWGKTILYLIFRLEYIMHLNLPTILSSNSFFYFIDYHFYSFLILIFILPL